MGITAEKYRKEFIHTLPRDKRSFAEEIVEAAFLFPVTAPPQAVWMLMYEFCMEELLNSSPDNPYSS